MYTAAWTNRCSAIADFGSARSVALPPTIPSGWGGGRSSTTVTASSAVCFPSGPDPTRHVCVYVIHCQLSNIFWQALNWSEVAEVNYQNVFSSCNHQTVTLWTELPSTRVAVHQNQFYQEPLLQKAWICLAISLPSQEWPASKKIVLNQDHNHYIIYKVWWSIGYIMRVVWWSPVMLSSVGELA